MKEGRTLPELACELERQACNKRDYLATVQALRVASNGHANLFVEGVTTAPGATDAPHGFPLSEIAHGQLAEYAGIPKPFYDRLRTATTDLRVRVSDPAYNPFQEDHPLYDVLVNTILTSKGEDRRLVRTLDGNARAFLSDSYNPDLDNFDIFRVAARVIEEQGLGPDDVVSAEVTERKLYLKVVSPKLQAVIQPANLHRQHGTFHYLKEPQVIQAGFIIQNSEVGLGSLSVQQVVMKLMCTNLWIKEEAYRQRHLGRVLEADEEGQLYRSDTRLADATARLLKVRDHVGAALDEHRFAALVGKMQDTTEVKLEGGIEKVVETTARRFALSQSEKESVLQHLIEGADLSLWGLTNAITAAAGHVESYDRATELEAIGGRMFDLSKAEVSELVRAA